MSGTQSRSHVRSNDPWVEISIPQCKESSLHRTPKKSIQYKVKNAIEDIPFTNNIFTEGNVCEIVNKPRVAHLHWSCYGGKYE